MAIYLNTITNEYPRHDGDLELLGWIPNNELPEGWVEVYQDDKPIPGIDQIAEIQPPILIDGVWKTTWSIRDMTNDELIAREEFLNKIQSSLT